jgi:hypothetical protein
MKFIFLCFTILTAIAAAGQVRDSVGSNNVPNPAPTETNTNKIGNDIFVKIAVDGSSNSTTSKFKLFPAREVFYKKRPEGLTDSFVVLQDPHTKKKLVFPSADPTIVYVYNGSELLACYLGAGGIFTWFPANFEISGSMTTEAATRRFALEFGDDQKIGQFYKDASKVSLRDSANRTFFQSTKNPSMPGTTSIESIEVKHGILKLDLLSEGGKFAGSFWINIKSKTVERSLVKSVSDNKQVFP